MKYLLLIYGNEADYALMTEAEQEANMGEHMAFSKMARERNVYVGGEALHPTSATTTVRVRDGKTLTTDGPFAETKEQLGGFYMVDCKDLDEAIEIASKIPESRAGSIEIRPVVIFE